jgi:hypothetical protein
VKEGFYHALMVGLKAGRGERYGATAGGGIGCGAEKGSRR